MLSDVWAHLGLPFPIVSGLLDMVSPQVTELLTWQLRNLRMRVLGGISLLRPGPWILAQQQSRNTTLSRGTCTKEGSNESVTVFKPSHHPFPLLANDVDTDKDSLSGSHT